MLFALPCGTCFIYSGSPSPSFLSLSLSLPLPLPQVLVSSSPFLTFGHVACNSALLEASRGARRLHIVDFGIGHAVQWPPFIQALSVLPGGPPHLRITGIDRPYVAGINKAYCLRQAGQRLKVGHRLQVGHRFKVGEKGCSSGERGNGMTGGEYYGTSIEMRPEAAERGAAGVGSEGG